MRYIIGIDEVGRGSLAGPVTVAAVAAPHNLGVGMKNLGKLRDSKKLTPKQRERWFRHIVSYPRLRYAVARVYPKKIDEINITKAANLAAERAYRRLTTNNRQLITNRIFLDGGLYIGNGTQPKYAKTVVRGDEKYTAVKAASIIAKVTRDRAMTRLAKQHTAYGFEIHKGYGTKAHRAAIRTHGPSEMHRLTFIRKFHTMKG